MKSHNLPGNDHIPALGLGTWKSKKGDVYTAVKDAIEIGYRHIDCAPAYENEKEVGAAIADKVSSGAVDRSDLWITSKLWNNAHLANDVQPALESTLSDLQLDYLDLYLIHWPIAFVNEVFFPSQPEHYLSLEEAPIIETWRAMERCVEKGMIKHIGVCNFNISSLSALSQEATIAPVMNQIELHPFLQQKEMIDHSAANNILLTAYSPLGSGDRPRRLKKENEPQLLNHPTIVEIAEKHKAQPAQILLVWALSRDTIVIPKSTNQSRLQQNFDAHSLQLDENDVHQIGKLERNFRYVDGKFFEGPGSPYRSADLWS